MLKQRVITAVVLAAAFLALLFLSPSYIFAAGTGLAMAVAAWEWAALSGWRGWAARSVYLLLTVVLALAGAWALLWAGDQQHVRTALVVICGWWAVALLWVQGYPSSAVLWGKPVVRAIMGWLVLIPAWCSLLILHEQPSGPVLILMAVVLVACADIGAYFAGRSLGRHKLAPAVSPGKTWEGFVGGLIAALLAGLLANAVWGDLDWPVVAGIVIPTALVSVLGDLFESMIKRHCGVKDSGHILPGHGGVLDRIDGLTAALPVFTLAVLLTGWQLA